MTLLANPEHRHSFVVLGDHQALARFCNVRDYLSRVELYIGDRRLAKEYAASQANAGACGFLIAAPQPIPSIGEPCL